MAEPSVPKLDNYVITEKLGSGTYATVYKAYKRGTRREVVAIKCVLKASLNRASTDNLLTEIGMLKTLDHPNIVKLKDFQWDSTYIYLIMEYCRGGDLADFIQRHHRLSEYSAKRLLQQLALALQYMRSKDVSHFDLKPHNILISSAEQPVLKIGDFGFAHYLISGSGASVLRGSPLYMAPEIITRTHYNEKADLWSVGVILYECLFGQAPFSSRNLKEVMERIKSTQPIELPCGASVSDKCRRLLTRLLQRDPDRRIGFDEFLSSDFLDLDHAPQATSLSAAVRLVTRAVRCDQDRDYGQAVLSYCEALDFFVPAIHYETNRTKKEALRKKVKEYVVRAEYLKSVLKADTVMKDDRPMTGSVEVLSDVYPQLRTAEDHIKTAQRKEAENMHSTSLTHYQLALEIVIGILKVEPSGQRRDTLQRQVRDWMSRAEALKAYLKVKDMDTLDESTLEEPFAGKETLGDCRLQ